MAIRQRELTESSTKDIKLTLVNEGTKTARVIGVYKPTGAQMSYPLECNIGTPDLQLSMAIGYLKAHLRHNHDWWSDDRADPKEVMKKRIQEIKDERENQRQSKEDSEESQRQG